MNFWYNDIVKKKQVINVQFDIIRLNNNIEKKISIDEVYSFTQDELMGTDLLKLDNVQVEGELFKNSLGNIELNVDVEGIMVLPCAITLKPVNYPFALTISGEIEELMENFEENQKKFQNTIDILPIIWENILMEIPMRVVSEDAEDVALSGDGWKFITGEEKTENSELSKLKDLL